MVKPNEVKPDEKWEIEEGLRTLERAAEVQADPAKMKKIRKAKKVKKIKKVTTGTQKKDYWKKCQTP